MSSGGLFAEGFVSEQEHALAGVRVSAAGDGAAEHTAEKLVDFDLLARLITDTVHALLDAHRTAVATTTDPTERLRRATEAHVRYHGRRRLEAFVGNRELCGLAESNRGRVLALRAEYETCFGELVDAGIAAGRFQVSSARLASCAVLDLGMGVAAWYRADGEPPRTRSPGGTESSRSASWATAPRESVSPASGRPSPAIPSSTAGYRPVPDWQGPAARG